MRKINLTMHFTIVSITVLGLYALLSTEAFSQNAATCTVETYFAPNDDSSEQLNPIEKARIREISRAQDSIHVTLYSFSECCIKKGLIEAKEKGVAVRVIIDKNTDRYASGDPNCLIYELYRSGIPIKKYTGSKLMHHKFMIIDNSLLATGSSNFSRAGVRDNWEDWTILKNCEGNTEFIDSYITQFERMWGSDQFQGWRPAAEGLCRTPVSCPVRICP